MDSCSCRRNVFTAWVSTPLADEVSGLVTMCSSYLLRPLFVYPMGLFTLEAVYLGTAREVLLKRLVKRLSMDLSKSLSKDLAALAQAGTAEQVAYLRRLGAAS